VSAAIEYCVRFKKRAGKLLVRQCYEWQVGQPRVERWSRKLRGEINAIGLAYIQQNVDRQKYGRHATLSN
jgi:hypothetical protein